MVTAGCPPPCVDEGSPLKSVIVTAADDVSGRIAATTSPRTRAARLLTARTIPASGGGLSGPVAIQACVGAARVEQLLVRAGLLDPPVVEHDDAPGPADRGQPVRD